jgi:hypothetical protein
LPSNVICTIQVRFLGLSGGVSVAETTRNVLKGLFSTNLAPTCNWKGKGTKFGIEKTVLKQVICGKLS